MNFLLPSLLMVSVLFAELKFAIEIIVGVKDLAHAYYREIERDVDTKNKTHKNFWTGDLSRTADCPDVDLVTDSSRL
jgi:hypothetical protein